METLKRGLIARIAALREVPMPVIEAVIGATIDEIRRLPDDLTLAQLDDLEICESCSGLGLDFENAGEDGAGDVKLCQDCASEAA